MGIFSTIIVLAIMVGIYYFYKTFGSLFTSLEDSVKLVKNVAEKSGSAIKSTAEKSGSAIKSTGKSIKKLF